MPADSDLDVRADNGVVPGEAAPTGADETAEPGMVSRVVRWFLGMPARFYGWVGAPRWVAIGLLALFMVVRVSDPEWLELLRLKTFDFYQQFKPRPIPETSPVVIVDLDEASLEEIGQWPWPHTMVAGLVRNLVAMQSGPIGFDVFFVERDRMSGQSLIDSLPDLDDATKEKLKGLPDSNKVFAKAIKASRRVVLGQAVLIEKKEYPGRKPLRSRIGVRGKRGLPDPRIWIPEVPGLLRNNAFIEPMGAGHGMVTIFPEPDGVVRRVPAFIKHKKRLYPTLALELLRLAEGKRQTIVFGAAAGISKVLIAKKVLAGKDLDVATDRRGRIWPYFSKTDKSKYVSAKDVLSGAVAPEKIKGHIVLIGTSAEGLKDIKTIPTERFIPGVEVHAQLVESVMQKQYLTRPPFADAVEMFIALVAGLLIIVMVPHRRIGAAWAFPVFAVAAIGAGATSWYLFDTERMLFDAGFAIITVLTVYILLTVWGFIKEELQRRQTHSAFSKYLSPAMVEQVVENPSLLTLGGAKRDMTLLFCDVRGFTSISELFDAEGLTVLINKLLTPLTDVILERKGTIDKYMGDCIMAFWNAPLDDADHARQGCLSALEMLAAMGPLNDRLEIEAKEEGRPHLPLRVGLGLNSGECVVGNMGTAQRMDYSVLGDTVNTAARLEGQSKSYGVDIVLGPNTQAQVPELATIELDVIQVKGKTVGLKIHALMGDAELTEDPEFVAMKAADEEMLSAYRDQQWSKAHGLVAKLRDVGKRFNLDILCDLYDARITAYEEEPPPADWDGVFIATTK